MPEKKCKCACHDNKLKTPYSHDNQCCEHMNGYVEGQEKEWKNEDLLNEADARIMEVVYEWASINFGVELWAQDSTQIREIISDILSSQAHALKEQMKACVPGDKKEKVSERMYSLGKRHGHNELRKKVLSAIENIEI